MGRFTRTLGIGVLFATAGCSNVTQTPSATQPSARGSAELSSRALRRSDDTPLVYLVYYTNSTVRIYQQQTGKFMGFIVGFRDPGAMAVDPDGNLHVSDGPYDRIYSFHAGKKKPYRTIETSGAVYDLGVDSADNLYAAVGRDIFIYPPGAKKPSATLVAPFASGESVDGLALDSAGNLFVISDLGSLVEFPAGSSEPVQVATLPGPFGLRIDGQNNLVELTRVTEGKKTREEFDIYAPPYTGEPTVFVSKWPIGDFAISGDNSALWATSSGNPPTAVELAYPSFDKIRNLTWRKGYDGQFYSVALYPPAP